MICGFRKFIHHKSVFMTNICCINELCVKPNVRLLSCTSASWQVCKFRYSDSKTFRQYFVFQLVITSFDGYRLAVTLIAVKL